MSERTGRPSRRRINHTREAQGATPMEVRIRITDVPPSPAYIALYQRMFRDILGPDWATILRGLRHAMEEPDGDQDEGE